MSEDIIDRDQLLHAFGELGLTNVNEEVKHEKETNICLIVLYVFYSCCLKSMKG